MLIILLVLIVAHTSLSQIFELTADDMIKSIIGDIEFSKKLDPPKTFKAFKTFDDIILAKNPAKPIFINETHVRMRVFQELKTTSEPTEEFVKVTPLPTEKPPNITIDHIKIRMRKIQLNKLLETQNTAIPDFSNDGDNPIHITRRFESIAKEVKIQRKPDLRQIYFEYQNSTRLYIEKQKTISLMEQFIYATRYKLPYMQLLRKKYSYHFKYKIGYCFALLRHLKQQQMLIYTSLHKYYTKFNNIMIHMRLYEKVVRLDVDIKDVCTLIRRLHYLMKLEDNPNYYDDSGERRENSQMQAMNPRPSEGSKPGSGSGPVPGPGSDPDHGPGPNHGISPGSQPNLPGQSGLPNQAIPLML